jgi:ribonuclease HIII
MNQHDREIDDLVAQFWRGHRAGLDVAREIRGRALAQPPASAIVAGRVGTILKGFDQPDAWKERIAAFETHTAHLIDRCHQIDQLGDTDTEPAAVFEILGEDTAGIDIETFDVDGLRKARLGKPRPDAAQAFLDGLGANAIPDSTKNELAAAAAELAERKAKYQCHALFTGDGYGVALGVQVSEEEHGQIVGFNEADGEMRSQAEAVLRHFQASGARWNVEWLLPYGGASIGLALAVASLVRLGKAQPDPLLAATGRIDANNEVCAVEGVPEKVRGAAAAGFRRVLVPAANENEAIEAVDGLTRMTIIPLDRLDQLPAKLSGLSGAMPIGSDGVIRFIRKLARLYGIDVVNEDTRENGYRLTVADAASRAYIDVFRGRRGAVTVGGKDSAKDAAERLLAEHLSRSLIEPRPAVSVLIANPARRDRLQTSLVDRGAEALPVGTQYQQWRYQLVDGASKALITMYTSGKCVVEAGQAPAHDEARRLVDMAVEGLGGVPQPSEPRRDELPSEPSPDPNIPHIGTDEAGKGDYFGPLVCAAVFVDASTGERLRAMGVRDSKTLSDKTVRRLAEEIRSIPRIWAVTTIQPARYNSLYAEMRREGKNLNTLVAWGHARSIEDLLGKRINAEYAVIDKFADERYLREKLLPSARQSAMRFDHRVRGESDIAVAAASVLARDAFVSWLENRSRELGFTLPKGASPEVIAVARRIVADGGEKALRDLAKLSFKTTQKVLGATDA